MGLQLGVGWVPSSPKRLGRVKVIESKSILNPLSYNKTIYNSMVKIISPSLQCFHWLHPLTTNSDDSNAMDNSGKGYLRCPISEITTSNSTTTTSSGQLCVHVWRPSMRPTLTANSISLWQPTPAKTTYDTQFRRRLPPTTPSGGQLRGSFHSV